MLRFLHSIILLESILGQLWLWFSGMPMLTMLTDTSPSPMLTFADLQFGEAIQTTGASHVTLRTSNPDFPSCSRQKCPTFGSAKVRLVVSTLVIKHGLLETPPFVAKCGDFPARPQLQLQFPAISCLCKSPKIPKIPKPWPTLPFRSTILRFLDG